MIYTKEKERRVKIYGRYLSGQPSSRLCEEFSITKGRFYQIVKKEERALEDCVLMLERYWWSRGHES